MFERDSAQKAASNDLPDQAQNQMFSALGQVRRPNVDDRAANGFRRSDDNVIVFGDLEGVEWLSRFGDVENSGIDCVGDGVVDQFTKDQTV